ncbi:MAG: amino acid adenylation domain-containing protein, partial [Verrucomicrobia bacterium]
LRQLSPADRDKEALRIAREETRKPFDLQSGPLLRVRLIRLDHEEHFLLLVMHHIVTDGWSMDILFREMADLYESMTEGRTCELPPLTSRYRDYGRWQRELVSGELLASHIDYWKKRTLHGIEPVLELPTDRPRPPVSSGRGATEHVVIDDETARKLEQLGRNENATLFMTLLAVFQTLLWRYSYQDSIVVGTPVAGRNEVQLESLVGFFVNTLLMRADFSGNPSFRELLRQLRSTALDAYAHQDLPFEKLVEEFKPERTLSRTPLFQVMLILQNFPRRKLELKGLTLEELEFDTEAAKFDLTLEVIESDGLDCAFEYNTDIFNRATIQRLIGHFKMLVEGVIQNPDEQISALPLLTTSERKQILEDWNNTAADYPKDLCIHTDFERQAERTPERIAFVDGATVITYRELNERANRLAHYLVSRGIRRGDVLGVSIERSVELMIGLLGILKAGAAYVPLDSSEPQQRLAAMVADSGVETVLTAYDSGWRVPGSRVRVLALDAEKQALEKQSTANPDVPMSSVDLAYLIYTSGSTGTPKGVEGTHQASINRFAWMWNAWPFSAEDVCCQKTALSFVDSVWEIFGPLLRGVPNVIVPGHVVLNPVELVQLLAQHKVTRIVVVPSLVRMLLDRIHNLAAELPELRMWTVSGETLTPDLAKRFRISFPHAKLLNIYGSSEVAADVTWHEVGEADPAWSVPIGKPISNTQIYILDRYLNPVPIGVRGEIHVGGVCLARGYWKHPENTVERFIANPFDGGDSPRFYKTGDLARYWPGGVIEYLGRADSQVKIRGMRVELGEIESTLRSHPDVRDAAVIVHGDGQKLIAYLTASNGRVAVAAELRRFVRSRLPEHMVPSNYGVLQTLPVLPSGKIDRRALASMEVTRPQLALSAYTVPRNDVERSLASIFSEVLKVQPVGREDNFFDLGGHSLLAVQVVSRIRRVLDVEVSVRAIFEQPAVAGLAETVEEATREGRRPNQRILSRDAGKDDRELLLARLNGLSTDEVRTLLDQLARARSQGS